MTIETTTSMSTPAMSKFQDCRPNKPHCDPGLYCYADNTCQLCDDICKGDDPTYCDEYCPGFTTSTASTRASTVSAGSLSGPRVVGVVTTLVSTSATSFSTSPATSATSSAVFRTASHVTFLQAPNFQLIVIVLFVIVITLLLILAVAFALYCLRPRNRQNEKNVEMGQQASLVANEEQKAENISRSTSMSESEQTSLPPYGSNSSRESISTTVSEKDEGSDFTRSTAKVRNVSTSTSSFDTSGDSGSSNKALLTNHYTPHVININQTINCVGEKASEPLLKEERSK